MECIIEPNWLFKQIKKYICILFALNQKKPTMLYNDVKVICKIMCSLVK